MPDAPRILFVGDLNFYSKGASRLRACEELGYQVRPLRHTPEGGAERGYVPPSLAYRVAWKLGYELDRTGVNRAIRDVLADFAPDVVWVEKGNMIRPGTLARIHAVHPGARICTYTDDDMFNPMNRSRFYTAGLNHYDVVFTTKSYNARDDELPALGARRVVMLDKAYDAQQHYPVEVTEEERLALGADVGFIGSFEDVRGEAMAFLARNGIDVRVWGNGWDGFDPGLPSLRVEKRALVNTPDNLPYTKGIRATAINLGFLRKANRDLQTDRSVEIPACEAFMLAEWSEEHERLFTDGEEAVYYRDADDMLAKVRHYLAHPEDRDRIARAGRRRAVESGYSLKERMRFMIQTALATPR